MPDIQSPSIHPSIHPSIEPTVQDFQLDSAARTMGSGIGVGALEDDDDDDVYATDDRRQYDRCVIVLCARVCTCVHVSFEEASCTGQFTHTRTQTHTYTQTQTQTQIQTHTDTHTSHAFRSIGGGSSSFSFPQHRAFRSASGAVGRKALAYYGGDDGEDDDADGDAYDGSSPFKLRGFVQGTHTSYTPKVCLLLLLVADVAVSSCSSSFSFSSFTSLPQHLFPYFCLLYSGPCSAAALPWPACSRQLRPEPQEETAAAAAKAAAAAAREASRHDGEGTRCNS